MSNCTVVNAVLDWRDAKKELTELTQLMEEAFIVFDYESILACKLPEITKVIEKSWVEFTKYPISFCESDFNKIREASLRVSKAFITRKDFNEILAPYKKAIEDYSSKLAKEVEKKYQYIIKLYNNFEQFGSSPLSVFFEQEQVKETFMQFLLS